MSLSSQAETGIPIPTAAWVECSVARLPKQFLGLGLYPHILQIYAEETGPASGGRDLV